MKLITLTSINHKNVFRNLIIFLKNIENCPIFSYIDFIIVNKNKIALKNKNLINKWTSIKTWIEKSFINKLNKNFKINYNLTNYKILNIYNLLKISLIVKLMDKRININKLKPWFQLLKLFEIKEKTKTFYGFFKKILILNFSEDKKYQFEQSQQLFQKIYNKQKISYTMTKLILLKNKTYSLKDIINLY